MTKPITPEEVGPHKAKVLPEFVVDAWNSVIAKNANGTGSITVLQKDAIAALLPFVPEGKGREHIFDQKWLDIEPMYEAAGWSVTYDKPAYNESGEAYFTFRSSNKK